MTGVTVIAFPSRGVGLCPYDAWHAVREDGGCPYAPPLALLLRSSEREGGWATFAADGTDPKRLRVQFHVNKLIDQGAPILSIGHVGPAGNAMGGPVSWLTSDPAARPGPVRDALAGAVAEIEEVATAHGYRTVAYVDPPQGLRGILEGRSYRGDGPDLRIALG